MADENKPFEENGEEDEDLIELVDEDGESTFFEHLATLEYKGDTYLALCEPENEDEDEGSSVEKSLHNLLLNDLL